MKTKFIHNKKRNTGFLFEVLVRGLTQASLDKNKDLAAALKDTIKESFVLNSELGKELKLYNSLLRQRNLSPRLADRLLKEAQSMHKNIDERKLYSEHNKLITRINSLLGKKAFFAFVPEYKSLATIAQLFHEKTDPVQRVVLEEAMIRRMGEKAQEGTQESVKPLDKLAYKLFVEKFNKIYGDALHPEQKKLLNEYILSSEMNGVGLKLHLNEELGRLKSKLAEAQKHSDVAGDAAMLENLQKMISLLESYAKLPVSENMIKQVLQVQELLREMET